MCSLVADDQLDLEGDQVVALVPESSIRALLSILKPVLVAHGYDSVLPQVRGGRQPREWRLLRAPGARARVCVRARAWRVFAACWVDAARLQSPTHKHTPLALQATQTETPSTTSWGRAAAAKAP
jgi:hypothetical protein